MKNVKPKIVERTAHKLIATLLEQPEPEEQSAVPQIQEAVQFDRQGEEIQVEPLQEPVQLERTLLREVAQEVQVQKPVHSAQSVGVLPRRSKRLMK